MLFIISTLPPVYKDTSWVPSVPRSVLAILPNSNVVTPRNQTDISTLFPSYLYPRTSTLKDRQLKLHFGLGHRSQVLRLRQVGPTAVITTHAAKETIGNTPAPLVLSQFSWKHLAPPSDDCHHQ
jgi:hypothetical protein